MIAARAILGIGVVAAASLGLACEASPSANASASAATTTERGGNCATCHMPEYEHAADPVHVDVKPTTCAVCHGQEGWRPSALQHPFWALTGGHEKAECSFCHGKAAAAVFKGTPKDCVACHRPEYDSSTFPQHETFPTKCADCHTTKGWKPATFTPPPPPPVAPVATAAPLGGRAPKALPKGATTGSPKSTSAPTTTPTSRPPQPIPTPPRTPTTRPPPDVTSRPSPLRR